MEIPFLSGVSGPDGRYPVNLFFVPETERGRAALIGTPGLLEYLDLSHYAEVRGLHVMNGLLYAVCGNTLYSITSDRIKTNLGTLLTATGHVFMSDNGTQLLISDGTHGYLYPIGGTFAKIADTDFPGATSVTFQDTYFIVTEPGTGKIWISAQNDGTSWDALDYATAEGAPDDALCVVSNNRELWVFGSESTEIYYNSGDVDFPFERIQGGFLEGGIAASNSVVKQEGSFFGLDDHGLVRLTRGLEGSIVSTPEIARHIASYSTISDAFSFSYVYQGNIFFQLTFPTANKSWLYNVTTGFWSELRSYPRDGEGNEGRHRANCYAYFDRKHIVGDYENGKLYQFDGDTYTDNGEIITRQRTAPEIHADRKTIVFSDLEIEFKAGVGLVTQLVEMDN